MAKKDVVKGRVRISAVPPASSTIKHVDDVYIVVTQAFCPKGHNLVTDASEEFDGYPGIRLRVSSGDTSGEVHLSPFHGDASKKGDVDWEPGTRLKVSCPVCGEAFERMAACKCDGGGSEGGDLNRIYLSPKLSESHVLAICNVWGCPRSRTVDNWQIISEYLEGGIGD